MRPTFEKTCQMFPSRSRFSPIFKRIDVLPRRLQILAPQTIMSLFNHLAVMLCKIYWNKNFIVKDFFSPLSCLWRAMAGFSKPNSPFLFQGICILGAAFIGSNFEDMYDFNERFFHQSIGAICNTSVN